MTHTTTALIIASFLSTACLARQNEPVTQPQAPAQQPASKTSTAPVEVRVLEDRTIVPNVGDPPAMRYVQMAQGLAYRIPSRWIPEKPSNPMRLQQIRIPAPEGNTDERTALITVTGSIGGTIDDNIARWVAQFTSVSEQPTLQKLRCGPLTIHELRVSGTFNAAMPGAQSAEPTPDTSMFGAIVEGGALGPVYFKAVGPRATLEARRTGWDMFLRNMELDPRSEAKPATPAQKGPNAPQHDAKPQENPARNAPAQQPIAPTDPAAKPPEPSKP